MLVSRTTKQTSPLLLLVLIFSGIAGHAQKTNRPQPLWWFGGSVAANFNFYRGTTQVLNENVSTPTAFHKGNGIRPYVSVLTEYRPNKTWGGMLNIAYDNRGGKFDGVMAPCDCPADLSTNISYLAIEPGIRLAPFKSGFYVFAGPTLSFNLSKEFKYTQDKQADKKGDWSDIRKTVFSAQAGAGIDLPLSASTSRSQMTLSPFVSFLTDIGHQPRETESWSFYTVRAGVAFKFSSSKKQAAIVKTAPVADPVFTPVPVPEKEVQFSVRAPKEVPANRRVKETFPFRNSVFFDLGSPAIPGRYVQLNPSQAKQFKEEQLQESQPGNLTNGRSSRQLAVYHNILNVLGDRMRSNPQSVITLTGSSDNNPSEGKQMAESIRQYLVTVFDINASRITTVGRDKPVIPSEQPGGTKELVLLREGDHRVDIQSSSPELLLQVGGSSSAFLKPMQITAMQEDPLDSHVIFNVTGANELLESWTVTATDQQGNVQHYGPYTKDQASVAGKTILGNNSKGEYKIQMIGKTKSGRIVTKQSAVSLVKPDQTKQQEGLRYSILFDFDKSTTIASYEKFLTDVVTPLIPENGTVIIHGHTDIIGDEKHNQTLSQERAAAVQRIIEAALLKTGKKGVTFETYGFGEEPNTSPFENNLPEERFYNRTVIIDIIPAK
jgi:outer membrane protein OmpA-like peptidoglycan-associated protein